MHGAMRLKVRADTFYLSDPEGGVYFRNNNGSFRMSGSMIDRWIEKLIPVWNGEHTLDQLTDGLPEAHRNRVFEIAETLLANGYVRDAGEDRPHRLTDQVQEKFASQIEFLDHFGGSGAYRFESYRGARVLAAGSGPFLLSLVSALLESGLSRFGIAATGATDFGRIAELADYARRSDPGVEWEQIAAPGVDVVSWRDTVQSYDGVLYVHQGEDEGVLRSVQEACRLERKTFLPAVIARGTGLAGPLVKPGSPADWESARRRLHREVWENEPRTHEASSTAEAMLTNVIAFEWFKTITGVTAPDLHAHVFLLNLETLEGSRHAFHPHPLVRGPVPDEWRREIDYRALRRESGDTSRLFAFFGVLTSRRTGIFGRWEEGDLLQLPLSQCLVQPVDPLSAGPAELLPEIRCGAFTHEEARREAGLSGIETYTARLLGLTEETGVGAGGTVEEAVCRAFHRCLAEALRRRVSASSPALYRLQPGGLEDARSEFYYRSLTVLAGETVIGAGEDLNGFASAWVGAGGCWFGCAGANRKSAMRSALRHALMRFQNRTSLHPGQIEIVPALEEQAHAELLDSAERILDANGMRLAVFDLAVEPFMKEGLAGIFGAVLKEAGHR